MNWIFQAGEKPQIKVTFDTETTNKITVKNVLVVYKTEKQVCELMKLAKEKLAAWEVVTE